MTDSEDPFSAAEKMEKSGKYSDAVELYLAAAKKFEEANNLKKCSIAYAKAGLSLELIQKNVEALEYLLKAVTILQNLNLEDESSAFYYSHLGFNYFILENFEKAAESYTTSAKIYEKDKSFKAATEGYWRAGFSYKQQADYARAESCYKKALKLSEEFGYKYQQAIVFGLLGILYGDAMNMHEEAAALYLRSGELFEELGDMIEARDKYIWASQSYLSAGKVEAAEKLIASINRIFPENNEYYI
nr:tetratricopeptide repeat protein [Candidatus Freyarchaeota archaeon]